MNCVLLWHCTLCNTGKQYSTAMLRFVITNTQTVFFSQGCGLALVSAVAFGLFFTFGSIAGVIRWGRNEIGSQILLLSVLCSTFFLVGPISQAKKLCDGSNIIGTVIKIVCIIAFVASVVFVFCAAFWVSEGMNMFSLDLSFTCYLDISSAIIILYSCFQWKQPVVAVLFCIIEFVALVV